MIRKVILILFFYQVTSGALLANEKHNIAKFSMGWYFPSINSMVSQTDFKFALDFWLKEFNHYIKLEDTEVRVFKEINTMQSAFNKGELSLIVAPPLLIVKHFDLNLLANGFMGTSVTGKPYGMVILAQNTDAINGIKDLKHKRLVLPKNDELAHTFLDTSVMPHFNKNYTQVFKSVQFLHKQNAIIHSLFFDQADVGVAYLETFNLMVELNPQIANKVKILKNFPIKSPNYSFFHKNFPEQHRQFFMQEVLKLNHSARSTQILNSFRMSSLAPCSVKSLEPFIDLNNYYQQLKKSSK